MNYLNNLWPKDCKYYKKVHVDTYYNAYSLRAARLAAEATRIASVNVATNKWRNAFSIVRPPGHHACASENKISGFCFINNVAVSADYLIKKHGY